MKKPSLLGCRCVSFLGLLIGLFFVSIANGQVQTAGTVFINVDATTLTPGTLSDVPNAGTLGGYFEAKTSAGASSTASIVSTNGVTAIQFGGSVVMQLLNGVGGTLIAPPAGLVGSNATASIEVWAMNPAVADDECMVSWGKRGVSGQNMAFNYGYNANLGAVTHTTTPDLGWDSLGGAPLNNYWHHLVYTYDGSVESVYVDGTLANSKAGAINIATNAGIMLAAEWTNSVVATVPALSTLFIARVRVHDGALTAAQVLNNFTVEKSSLVTPPPAPEFLTAAPVHRYSFNETPTNIATGLPIHDSIGTADGVVRGTNVQTEAQFARGRLIIAASETGTRPGPQMLTAYGDLPGGLISANSTNNGGTGELSVEVWYKNMGGVASARVFDFGSCGTLGSPGLRVPDVGGRPSTDVGLDWFGCTSTVGANINQRRLQWQNKDPLPAGSTTNSANISTDVTMMGSHMTDRHLVVTWKESTGQVIAYENGTRVASMVVSNAMSSINDLNVWLGRSVHTDAGFAGEYDEVRFYTNVLTPGQVLGNTQVGADTINTGAQVPQIIAQPQSGVAFEGSPATFYVTASGSPAVAYQWQYNGAPISGATANTYTVSAASLANNGAIYSCVVSNFANGTANALTSTGATLTVIPNQALPAQFLRETRDGTRDNYNTTTNGIVGGLFTTGPTPAVVTHLGYYDLNKDGLVKDHHVGIFASDGATMIASVLVPAGTSAYLTNGYRYVALDTPIVLNSNTLYYLTAEVFASSGDGWPDVFTYWQPSPYFVGTNPPSTRQGKFVGATWPAAATSGSATVGGSYAAPNLACLPIGPAVCVMQQTNVTQYATLSVTLSVIVNGEAPVTVQWYKGGALLAGKTNSILYLPSVTVADGGDYYAVASNGQGSVQSATATVTVLPDSPVSITQPPSDATVPEGYAASFSIGTAGTPPIFYQWNRNGSPIAAATNSIYNISAVSLADNNAAFSCTVSNFANSTPTTITSANATLTVQPNKAPVMQTLFQTHDGSRDNFTGMAGGLFQVGSQDALVTHLGYYDLNGDGLNMAHRVGIFSSAGGAPLVTVTVPVGTDGYLTNGYRWVPLPLPFTLTNNASYIVAAEVFASSGDGWPDVFTPTWNSYYVGANGASTRTGKFSGSAWPAFPTSGNGSDTMYGAPNLAVLPVGFPVVAMQQTNFTRYVGDSVTFSVLVNGQAPLTLQWYKAPNTLLNGQTGTSLTLASLTQANAGDYFAIGTNAQGTGQSQSATLTVYALTPPQIQQQPQPQTVWRNQSASFNVSAIGQQPLSYQWFVDGAPISGATNSALVVNNVTITNQGNYQVTISNSLGSANSTAASLTVLTPADGSYSAAAIDAAPLVYYQLNDTVQGSGSAFNLGSLGAMATGTYEGTIAGDLGPQPPDFPNFETNNQAVLFDGTSADVSIPALNLTNSTVQVTLAAWIKRNGPQETYAGIVFYRGTAGANGFGIKQDSGGTDVLEYHWNSTYFSFNSGLAVPDNQWTFVALTVRPTKATLYMFTPSGLQSATNVATHTAVAFAEASYVGWDTAGGSQLRRFYGLIDEPMIFNRALTQNELSALYAAASNITVNVQIGRSGSNVVLSWARGTLQQADDLTGPYTDVLGASSPFTADVGAAKKFYRVKVQ